MTTNPIELRGGAGLSQTIALSKRNQVLGRHLVAPIGDCKLYSGAFRDDVRSCGSTSCCGQRSDPRVCAVQQQRGVGWTTAPAGRKQPSAVLLPPAFYWAPRLALVSHQVTLWAQPGPPSSQPYFSWRNWDMPSQRKYCSVPIVNSLRRLFSETSIYQLAPSNWNKFRVCSISPIS